MRGFIVAALVSIVPARAAADGEATPLVGAAVEWSPTDQDPSGMVGIALDAAWWHGRVGVGIDGSGRTHVASSQQPRAATVAASLRLRVFEWMAPSLMEPRDAEAAIELQAIAERVWWEHGGTNAPDYGVGIVLRVRGGGDDGSNRIAESRFFLRVMSMPTLPDAAVARSTAPAPMVSHQLAFLVGIGASFGGGERHYMDRFRWRVPEWPPR